MQGWLRRGTAEAHARRTWLNGVLTGLLGRPCPKRLRQEDKDNKRWVRVADGDEVKVLVPMKLFFFLLFFSIVSWLFLCVFFLG